MAAMVFRKNDIFYDAGSDDNGKAFVNEWHLRSIMTRSDGHTYGYLIHKIELVTWVKTGKGSKATWGWDPIIPYWCRKKFRIDQNVPDGFAKSRTQALRLAIKQYEAWAAEDDDDWAAKSLKGLRSLLTREPNKK